MNNKDENTPEHDNSSIDNTDKIAIEKIQIEYSVNISEEEESEQELDERLIKVLRLDVFPEPADSIRQNVLKAFSQEFKYRIIRTKLRDFLYQLISPKFDTLLGLKVNFSYRIATVAMVLFLVTIGIAGYYSLYHLNKNDSKPVANNNIPSPKPTINTSAPIAKEITPKSQENNKDNIENVNTNNDTNIAKDKINNTKKYYSSSHNQIADNKYQKQNVTIEKASESSGTRLIQPYIKNSLETVYLGELVDEDNPDEWMAEFQNELKDKIKKGGYWQIVEKSNNVDIPGLRFKITAENKIILVDEKHKSNDPIWSSTIKVKVGNPKDVATSIINELFNMNQQQQ